ncbi:MAG: sulfatase/phosphatase domain-containing protein, partial [Opitutaceae bacterium]
FRWPGRIPAGRVTDAVAGNIDLLPTLAAAAGAAVPADRVIDGRDLLPLLTGATDRGPHAFHHYLAGSAEGRVNYRGLRDDRWKLVVAETDGALRGTELYDLHEDVSEKFDRLKQHPEVVARLEVAARDFLREMRANLRPAGRVARN